MSRSYTVVGNWKMELSHKGGVELMRTLISMTSKLSLRGDVVVCPSYPALSVVAEMATESGFLQVGAQDVHMEKKGAFTGAVSVMQIAPFVKWCLVGHSEVRDRTRETDEEVVAKANELLNQGITPIICIGETGEEHENDQTVAKVSQQVQTILSGLNRVALGKVIIAYEPIWAIGVHAEGVVVDPQDISEVMLLIRKLVATRFGGEMAEKLRLLYGGSVKSDNVAAFMNEPTINGVLVGGASVHPLQFVDILKQVEKACS